MGSWYSAGQHSRSECVPGLMCHALVQPQTERKETVPVSKGLRMVWLAGARATGDCDLRSPWQSDAESFSRVTDCTVQGGCHPPCRLPLSTQWSFYAACAGRAPGPLPASDSKPLFTESVRSPHRRPPSPSGQAKIQHYSQLPVPA